MTARKRQHRLIRLILFLTGLSLLLNACEPLISLEDSVPEQITPGLVTPPVSSEGLPTPVTELSLTFYPRTDFPGSSFSLSPVKDYLPFVSTLQSQREDNRLMLYNEDKSLFFSFSADELPDGQSNEACLNAVLERMKGDWLQFTPGVITPSANPVNSSGLPFSGVFQERPSRGSLIASYQNQRCYIFLAVFTEEMAGEGSSSPNLGAILFDGMLKTIEIGTLPLKPDCQISDDADYGRTVEKPIQVGNTNIRDGKNRVELYLLTLRGPAGEEILFTRQLPVLNQEGGVVDVYSISYAGSETSMLLYFDIYTFAQPLAIQGFTCEAPFPLKQP